ncbi:MAG TPA: GNAT family N-acetyltransferase [Niabella sp.]|nr:GNAT family N-acetyltransferase [Niabella sp.]
MKPEIEISVIQNIDELNTLISVFEDVFEMANFKRPDTAYLANLLRKNTFFGVVAKTNGKIIGGLTVYVLDQYYSAKPLAYIYDLAVLTDFQRQGIGKKLIIYTNDYCRKEGFEGAFVQAEKADDYAVDFYRLTHPTDEMQVVHFFYDLKNN